MRSATDSAATIAIRITLVQVLVLIIPPGRRNRGRARTRSKAEAIGSVSERSALKSGGSSGGRISLTRPGGTRSRREIADSGLHRSGERDLPQLRQSARLG